MRTPVNSPTPRSVDDVRELALAVVRRDPCSILQRAEAKKAQAAGEPRPLQAPILGNGMPEDSQTPRAGGSLAHREDPTIPLIEKLAAARRKHVEGEPTIPRSVVQRSLKRLWEAGLFDRRRRTANISQAEGS